MGKQWLPQKSWQLGEVSPTYANRFGTEEQAFGAQTLTNWYVDYDGSLNYRFGTSKIFDSAGGLKARVMPISVGGKDFLMVLTSGPTADTDQKIRIYGRATDGSWDTTPRNLGNGLQPSQLPANNSNDTLPHNYTEAQLDELEYSVLGDYVFITHPSHPTTLLKYGVNFSSDFWTWNPFFGGDAEVVSFRESNQLTPVNESGTLFLESTAPIFEAAHVNGVVMAGDIKPATATVDGKGAGRFWRILEVETSTRARVLDISGDSPSSLGPVINSNYAGPWTAGELNPALQNTDVAMPGGQPYGARFTADSQLGNSDMVGAILHIRLSGEDYYFLGTTQAGAVPSAVDYVNVGQPTPGGGIPVGTPFQVMQLAESVEIGAEPAFHNVTIEVGDNQGGTSQLSLRRLGNVPEDHLTHFQSINSTPVGGAIFVNGGIARVVSRDFSVPGPVETYNIIWEREPITSAPSREWGLGPSIGTGFAGVTTTHQSRLVLSGYKNSAIVLSRTNDPTAINALQYVGLADAPLNLSLVATATPSSVEKVEWLSSETDLLVGTNLGEYSLRGSPITSTSLGLDRHSEYGGEKVRPVRVGARSLFVQNGGRVLREMQFTESSQRFESPNITRHAEHILADGEEIRRMVAIYNPAPVVFILTTSGRIVLLSRSSEDGVVAFSTLTTTGTWVDIARARNGVSDKNEVVAVALRNGNHYIERFEVDTYLDAAQTSTSIVDIGGGGVIITGAEAPLLGQEVAVFVDNIYWGTATPTPAGEINLSLLDINNPTTATFGIPYTATAKFTVLDSEDGTTVGTIKHQTALRLFVEDSIGGDAGGNLGLSGMTVVTGEAQTPVTDWVDAPQLEDSAGRTIGAEFTVSTPFKFKICTATFNTEWRS